MQFSTKRVDKMFWGGNVNKQAYLHQKEHKETFGSVFAAVLAGKKEHRHSMRTTLEKSRLKKEKRHAQ